MHMKREQQEACRMARAAGDILMQIYKTDFDVEFKSPADPVTRADKLANEFLCTELRQAFPDDGIVAEETEDSSDALRMGRCWYVDPLDGTKEFIAKNGEFSVMLGLCIDGRSRLGVVYQPVKDKLYWGVAGEGAFLEQQGRVQELRVSEEASPENLRLVVSRSHRDASIDTMVKRLGIRQERRSGSVGLKIGLIAEQQADLYVHLSDKSSVWDSCGPEAILHAAGGYFFDLAGDPFYYDGSGVRNIRGIFACNARAKDKVLPIVRELAAEVGLLESR